MTPRTDRRPTRVAAVGAAVLLLAGCSAGTRPDEDGEGRGGSYELTTMTPAPTSEIDHVTWNVFQGEPQTIDPFRSADYSPNMINANMCESLLSQTPEFTVEPNLAASFDNPDPLHWVYDLREDVTFWNGEPMTAEDVAFSLERNLTDPTSFYHYLYENVESVEVSGEHQVTVALTEPDYLFHDELSSFAGVVVDQEFFEENEDAFGSPDTGVMCTGPFRFHTWEQGESITVRRYDDYWNEDLRPRAAEVEFTFLTDDSAITSGLLSGQIDGTYTVPTSGYGQLAASDVGTLSHGPAPLSVSLLYTDPEGPMSDPSLRRALQMAIDWEGIGAEAYSGTARPTPLQTPPSVFGFAESELAGLVEAMPAPASGEVDQASELVAALPGEVRGETVTMVVPETTDAQQLGLSVKDAADRIGLDFDLQVVPGDVYTNYLYDPRTREGVDVLYTQFWPNVPNPLDWMGATAVSGGIFNLYGYEGVDELFQEARSLADPDERAGLLVEMEGRLHDDLLPMTPGLEVDNTVWMNDRVTGAPAAFAYVFHPWAAYLGGTETE